MERRYRVGEFAALTGVSVRTLHHYDQIGLLRPTERSDSGYRLYSGQDLLGLQQILTLRYLGFPLEQIGKLLRQPEFNLVASMRIQRRALRDRIAELESIEAALGALVERRMATGQWAWELVVQASASVQDGLHQKGEKMESYYTPEQMKQWEQLGREFPADARLRIEEGWTALLADVRANRDLDPASPEARALADRWQALTDELARAYQGYPELWKAIGENYQQGRFVGHERAPQPEDFAFIEKVNAARKDAGPGGPGSS
jgi:MerR family transcriptional regulator, thiopeptide resistance regulator